MIMVPETLPESGPQGGPGPLQASWKRLRTKGEQRAERQSPPSAIQVPQRSRLTRLVISELVTQGKEPRLGVVLDSSQGPGAW